MNDLKPFKHGDEGTHYACIEMVEKHGEKVKCCECTGHKCKTDKIHEGELTRGGE